MNTNELRRTARKGEDSRTQFKAIIPRDSIHGEEGLRRIGRRNGTTLKTTLKTSAYKVAELLIDDPGIAIDSICKATGLTRDGVNYQIRVLKAQAGLRRIGGRKEGEWKFAMVWTPSRAAKISSQGAK